MPRIKPRTAGPKRCLCTLWRPKSNTMVTSDTGHSCTKVRGTKIIFLPFLKEKPMWSFVYAVRMQRRPSFACFKSIKTNATATNRPLFFLLRLDPKSLLRMFLKIDGLKKNVERILFCRSAWGNLLLEQIDLESNYPDRTMHATSTSPSKSIVTSAGIRSSNFQVVRHSACQ